MNSFKKFVLVNQLSFWMTVPFSPDPRTKDLEPRHPRFEKEFVPQNEIEANLFDQCIHSQEYLSATCFRDQIGILCSYLRNEKCHVSFQRIGLLYGKNSYSIKYQFDKYVGEVKSNGRPPTLDQNELKILKDEIERILNDDDNPTYDYLTNFINEETHKNISQKELRSIIFYNFKDLYKGVPGIPLDENRKDCSEAEIDQYYDILENALPNVNQSFCFNVDEVGYQEFADAMEVTVLVRADYTKPTCCYSVDRNFKRATAIHAICTDGEYIQPWIIVSRKTLEKSIDDLLPLSRFHVVSQSNGYVNQKIFDDWFYNFCINLFEKRKRLNYWGPPLLIMDGFRPHHNSVNKVNMPNLNLYVLFLPAHSSDQTQPLDLGTFGLSKRNIYKISIDTPISRVVNQLNKIVSSLWMASNPAFVVKAFRSAGICRENGRLVCRREKARAVRHYEASHIESILSRNDALTNAQQTVRFQRSQPSAPNNITFPLQRY